MLALTQRATKFLTLLKSSGYQSLEEFAKVFLTDNLCPAICMAEGCDCVTEMESDQDGGYCEACGGNTVTSGLALADLI
jgi:hypothetical protein